MGIANTMLRRHETPQKRHKKIASAKPNSRRTNAAHIVIIEEGAHHVATDPFSDPQRVASLGLAYALTRLHFELCVRDDSKIPQMWRQEFSTAQGKPPRVAGKTAFPFLACDTLHGILLRRRNRVAIRVHDHWRRYENGAYT
jgi:hypothetical protein